MQLFWLSLLFFVLSINSLVEAITGYSTGAISPLGKKVIRLIVFREQPILFYAVFSVWLVTGIVLLFLSVMFFWRWFKDRKISS